MSAALEPLNEQQRDIVMALYDLGAVGHNVEAHAVAGRLRRDFSWPTAMTSGSGVGQRLSKIESLGYVDSVDMGYMKQWTLSARGLRFAQEVRKGWRKG